MSITKNIMKSPMSAQIICFMYSPETFIPSELNPAE